MTSAAKVTPLKNRHYAEVKQQQHIKQQQRHYLSRIHRRRLTLIVCAFSLIFAALIWQIVAIQRSNHALVVQSAKVDRQVKVTRQQQQNLKIKIKELNNSDYLAKYIREKYGYSKGKGNEIIFTLPGQDTSY